MGTGDGADEADRLQLPGLIGESDVPPPSKGLGLRLLGLLVGLGLVLGIAVAGGATLLTVVWPESSTLCDAAAGPCSDVSVQQIAEFSQIELPDDVDVESVRYATVEGSFGLLFATVVLPQGATNPLREGNYRVAPTLSWAGEVDALMLDNVVLYEGIESMTGPGFEASSGQRPDGRTVLIIRVSRAL